MPRQQRQQQGGSAGDQRRLQIVAAAQDVIAQKGFEGFRVREVADTVGINIATLHYHFPTKEALVAAVVNSIVGRLDRVPPPAENGPLDPPAYLSAHMHFVLDQFDTQRGQFVVLNELYTRAVRDEAMRRTLDAGDTAWKDYLLGILRAGQDGGHFRADLDPEAAAILITGFLKSLLLHPGLTVDSARHAADELLRSLTPAS
ncbi:TetR/AcrR family transcriptional regulator [Streptomyces sp. NPDC088736]|uniref:TetR/AcrR family transcriptional regulator n=1 Tax=Streptomyces sp. NPDC088736 TaxID=3365881 RepID=UPI00381B76A6